MAKVRTGGTWRVSGPKGSDTEWVIIGERDDRDEGGMAGGYILAGCGREEDARFLVTAPEMFDMLKRMRTDLGCFCTTRVIIHGESGSRQAHSELCIDATKLIARLDGEA